jgi:AbrB family looped-hinge helix DNA binding protein
MKRFPKLLQADSRGQIVIPKEIRQALGIDESTGFFAYVIDKEGIFLKKVDSKPLDEHPEVKEIKEKARALGVDKKNVEHAEASYKKQERGGFEEL